MPDDSSDALAGPQPSTPEGARAGLVPASLVRPPVAALIRADRPDWSEDSTISAADLHRYRMQHVRQLLEADRGMLSAAEQAVLDSLARRAPLAADTAEETEEQFTFGERLSDRIATFGGSWTFISIFGAVIVLWMLTNTVLLAAHPFDPYPFILLNLVLSCLAAVQAPIIMMSQNRQETKDRARAEHDYQINLKAELEIRQLHEKVDHQLREQWQRLLEMQATQAELLDELRASGPRRPARD